VFLIYNNVLLHKIIYYVEVCIFSGDNNHIGTIQILQISLENDAMEHCITINLYFLWLIIIQIYLNFDLSKNDGIH
jgi:hypothetical protein